jgi:hypothetical protein
MTFDPPLALLPMLQLLHAFLFGATHLRSMQLLAPFAPARQFATGQGDLPPCWRWSWRAAWRSPGVPSGVVLRNGRWGWTFLMALSDEPDAQGEMTMATTVDDRRETVSLIGSDKVEGTAVYGKDDRKIGTVQRVMIDKLAARLLTRSFAKRNNSVIRGTNTVSKVYAQ